MTDLHEENESQRAPGYDPELHDCSVCLDSGLSLIDGSYCDACHLGAARARQDKFSDELQAHGFKNAMWLVFRSTQKTERAIAAAEKALLLYKIAKLEEKIAQLEERMGGLIRTVETHGQWIWRDGEPPFPHNQEWFVAETIYGDKVVLRDRDREFNYSYQYTTADHTYMAAKNIKRWAQFPDSDYMVPPTSTNGEQN